MPATLWDRGQVCQEWPPPTVGPAAVARSFHATLLSAADRAADPGALGTAGKAAGSKGGGLGAGKAAPGAAGGGAGDTDADGGDPAPPGAVLVLAPDLTNPGRRRGKGVGIPLRGAASCSGALVSASRKCMSGRGDVQHSY